MMKGIFLVLFGIALTTLSSGQSQPAETPTIKGVLDGSRTAVFESPQQSCNQNDIPDAMARAFRDSTGTVHLVAASSELFQNLARPWKACSTVARSVTIRRTIPIQRISTIRAGSMISIPLTARRSPP